MPISPEKLTIQWHDSPEAVLREYWKGPAEAEGLDVDELLLESEGGGLTFDGEEVTFTTAEQLEGMRRQGCWGFVDTNSGQIHAWAAPDIAPEMLMHLLGHEIGHVTGEAHPDPLLEELRAEQFGRVAAVAYHLASKTLPAPNHLARVPAELVRDLISYGESGKVAEPWMVKNLEAALAHQALREPDPLIETCDENGHRYAKLPDHPMRDGSPRCPHCMAIGLDRARAEIKAMTQAAQP